MQKLIRFRWKLTEKSNSKVGYFFIDFSLMLQLCHSAVRSPTLYKYKIHVRSVRRSSWSHGICAVTRPGTYVNNAATSTKTVKFSYPKSALAARGQDYIFKWHRRCSLYDDVRNYLEYIYIYPKSSQILQYEIAHIMPTYPVSGHITVAKPPPLIYLCFWDPPSGKPSCKKSAFF